MLINDDDIVAGFNERNELAFKLVSKRIKEYSDQLCIDDIADSNDELLIKRIYSAIDELPDRCKSVFKMLFIEEMMPVEIAKLLNIDQHTVYTQKNRALNTLKAKLL